jgi:hypothetical protein
MSRRRRMSRRMSPPRRRERIGTQQGIKKPRFIRRGSGNLVVTKSWRLPNFIRRKADYERHSSSKIANERRGVYDVQERLVEKEREGEMERERGCGISFFCVVRRSMIFGIKIFVDWSERCQKV